MPVFKSMYPASKLADAGVAAIDDKTAGSWQVVFGRDLRELTG